MSSIWLFIFALAICSFAHAEDYDYDELVSEEPIQVVFDKIDWSLFLQSNPNVTSVCHCIYYLSFLYNKLLQKQFEIQNA